MPPKRKSPSAALPHTHILPHSPSIRRLLSRLTKDSLLDVVLGWLEEAKVRLYKPDLTNEDDEEEDESTLDEVRGTYEGWKTARVVKGKDVVERVVDREWRNGLNLLQIAELDYRYLLDHPTTHKWTAATLHPLNAPTSTPPTPHFHAPTFTHTLHTLLHPLLLAHIFLAAHPTLPLTLLRLQLHEPTSTTVLPSPKRTFYLAFPTNAPGYIYHNIAASPDSLRDITRTCIAAAISRQHARFELRPSALSAKTLEAMVYYRGCGGGEGGMVGAWSVYADGTLEDGPLELPGVKREAENVDMGGRGEEEVKRVKVAEGRFGSGGKEGDGKGLESVEFTVMDLFPGDEEGEDFRPTITVKLEGSHVFAGIRGMVERGEGFDGAKMPGWITGEGGVSLGTVRDGKLLKKRW